MRDPLLDLPEPPERVCGVCGFTLDHLEGQGYLHLAQVGDMANHVTVPLDPSEVTWPANVLCDFCTGVPAPWRVLTDDFVVRGEGLVTAMRGDWIACPVCVDLVRRKRWTELINRVHDVMPHITRRSLRDMYEALDRHMIGIALRPADE